MEDAAYLFELLAGLFYLGAAVPLLRRAKQSDRAAEKLLGITFLLFGISYVFYELPYVLQSDALLVPLSVTGHVIWAVAGLTTGLFTRLVFHPDKAWATRLIAVNLVLLAAGFVVSGINGDWEGMAPLTNPGYWLAATGHVLPCVWVGIAGLTQYANARRRVRLGLCDPVVCNRFLLFGLFGVMQILTIMFEIPMYIEFEKTASVSEWMDQVLGALEMVTILCIWLAFFPPAAYRGWIMGERTTPAAEHS